MRPSPQHHRLGFTLVELLLTLAILVTVTAVSIPAMRRSQQDAALREGLDLVKSRLMQARLAAMDLGEPTSFAVRIDHSTFRIQLERSQPVITVSLPDGVRFVAEGKRSGEWSLPIWFFPNGTAMDAAITLSDDRQQTQTVVVRRLTGAVSSSARSDIKERVR